MSLAQPRQEAFLSRLRDDRGEVTSAVIMVPIAMLAILLGIHFALVLHGRNVANAAAQDGVQAAQLEHATIGNGNQAAMNTLGLFPGIRDASVSIREDPPEDPVMVIVTVKGSVATPLEGLFGGLFTDFEITRSGPLERFYYESERE